MIDNVMLSLQQKALPQVAPAAQQNNNLSADKLAGIKAASKDFEAMFVSEMLGHMFSGVDVDPEFGGGKGEEMFRSMMVEEYGKMIAKGPGIGVSDQIQRAMIELQEKTTMQQGV